MLKFMILEAKILKSVKMLNSGFRKAKILKSAKSAQLTTYAYTDWQEFHILGAACEKAL